MKVFFAADHAGYALKEELVVHVRELGYEVEDLGAHALDESDDYPELVARAARAVASGADARAIVLGGSGQGEAMVANRFRGVRAAVYYGPAPRTQTDAAGTELDVLTSARAHNDTNVLALGARFLSEEEAREAVGRWLETPFSNGARHVRRLALLEEL